MRVLLLARGEKPAEMRKRSRIVRVSRVTTDGVLDCRSLARRAGWARRSTSIVPVPVGQPFAAVAATTAVCAEVAVALPAAFVERAGAPRGRLVGGVRGSPGV
jgi:hypothetical protein